jgi:type IV pilus assembly protein PilV
MMNAITRSKPARSRRKQRGVALLEAMIATVILALGLLGALGMQARAYSTLADAGMRAEATLASEKLLSMMTVDQAGLPDYGYSGSGSATPRLAGWLAETKAAIPGAFVTINVATINPTRRQVDILISWTRKQGSLPSTHQVTAYIAGSQ